MSSSTKIDNRKKYLLILGKGPTQGLENTPSRTKIIQLILLKIIKIFVWACFIMEKTVIYLLMVQKFINLKQTILKIVATTLCLENILKDWSIDNMKMTALNGYVYDLSADLDVIAVAYILGIVSIQWERIIWYKNP